MRDHTWLPKSRRSSIIVWSALLLTFVVTNIAKSHHFEKLDEAIPWAFVAELAPVFDFDGDGCLPSAGISRHGQQNGGLRIGGNIGGMCRLSNFLDTSNTLHRYNCTSENGSTYCGHFYALYFLKDQCTHGPNPVCGHRHDWEYAAIWTKNGVITHGSYSAHGSLNTRSAADLPFENGHLKIVYHKHDPFTHAMRFAKSNERAENPYGKFVTPTLISWDNLTGDGLDNKTMLDKLNSFNFGKANIPCKDSNFLDELNGGKPLDYPTFSSIYNFTPSTLTPILLHLLY